MINKRIILIILISLFFNDLGISQDIKGSIIKEQVTNSSIFDVDFDRLNSFNIDELKLLASISFLNRDYEKSVKYYLDIVEHNIDDAQSLYKLACCYAMLQKPEYASNFLVMAINAGYNNFSKIKNEECFKLLGNNINFYNTLNDVLKFGLNYGETVYVEANVLIKCRVIVPKNFNPNKKYSLLIGLHGFGGNVEDFCSLNNLIDSDEYIYVIPEAPYILDASGSGRQQYSWGFCGHEKELWKKSDPEVMVYIINVVDQINSTYLIDKNYILGFSQGASYAYATGIKNTDKIDAVITLGGRLPDTEKYPWFLSNEDLMKGRDLKIFIAHGRNDSVISYKESKDAKKILSKLNYDVELLLFDGEHSVEQIALDEAIRWIENSLR